MSIQVWILFSLAALSATTPINPEFVLSSYNQPTAEEIFYPFDVLDDLRNLSQRPQKVKTRVEEKIKKDPAPLPLRPGSDTDVTPVFIAPNDPGFKAVYASLNPLEYAADLQEQREALRKGQEAVSAEDDEGADYDDEDNWKSSIHRQIGPSY
ncbi:uncharacterized protein LOC124169359 [Ischnura elegans]|uniref:uncharacterized protein LOC124169359 n=1 Tax=Ischnura elegans TaxID=197161 RepID=UPI001ED89950|nr:uncharacterized protein LOC124169359 [Ischnura elegans]